jgi:aryl-alcohol dehydrogenase-like predicted oxidoreductase
MTQPLPRLVLGTMTFGAQVDADAARRMLDIAADAGITMLDTANVYAGGASESMIGELIAGNPGRFAVASKVGMPSAEAGGAAPLSGAAIARCAEASLRRLGVDTLDVYYLHQPDRATPIAETLEAVDVLVRAGKVRAVGVSNYAAWQLAELVHTARDGGWTAPTVSQPLYNLLARRIEQEYVEYSASAGLANVVYNPLAGGLLTGKHRYAEPVDEGRFGSSGLGTMYRQRYWSHALFDAVDAIAAAGREHGLTSIEVALRWLRSRPAVTSILLGASNVDHLVANLHAATDDPLDQALTERLDEIWQLLDGPAPAYNR